MKGFPKSVIKRASELASLLAYHREKYHEKDAPEISDEVYDSLVRELATLYEKYPTLKQGSTELDSVGGKPSDAFTKVRHQVQQWSFDNVFFLGGITRVGSQAKASN